MLGAAEFERQQPTRSSNRLLAIFRTIGVAVPAGALAGFFAAGIGGRIAMRISGIMFFQDHPGGFATTDKGNQVGDVTAGGTIFLIIFGTILGIMGAYFYIGIKPWLPGPLALRSLFFGVILLLLLSPLILDPANEDFQRFGSPTINAFLFALLFLIYGLVIAPVDARLNRWLPANLELTRRDLNISSVSGYIVLLGGVVAGMLFFQGLIMMSLMIFLDGENRAELLRGAFLVAAIATMLPAYFLLLPTVQESGYQATFRERRVMASIIGGGALLVLLAGAAITTSSIFSIVTG